MKKNGAKIEPFDIIRETFGKEGGDVNLPEGYHTTTKCVLVLEAVFAMPLQKMRMGTFNRPLWCKGIAAFIDQSANTLGIVGLSGN